MYFYIRIVRIMSTTNHFVQLYTYERQQRKILLFIEYNNLTRIKKINVLFLSVQKNYPEYI